MYTTTFRDLRSKVCSLVFPAPCPENSPVQGSKPAVQFWAREGARGGCAEQQRALSPVPLPSCVSGVQEGSPRRPWPSPCTSRLPAPPGKEKLWPEEEGARAPRLQDGRRLVQVQQPGLRWERQEEVWGEKCRSAEAQADGPGRDVLPAV